MCVRAQGLRTDVNEPRGWDHHPRGSLQDFPDRYRTTMPRSADWSEEWFPFPFPSPS